MKIFELTKELEKFAPLSVQEDYDNCGLIIGDPNAEIESALICLDLTDEIMEEAIRDNHKLIISHHPIIFKGLKKINGKGLVERLVVKAIKNDIAIYAFHTNADNVISGVNEMIAEKLGMKDRKILSPKRNMLKKLVTFCPIDQAPEVRKAMFDAGGGNIGNYDQCSFNTEGTGSFRANDNADPFVGNKNETHFEKEFRIEMIFPEYVEGKIVNALIEAHPYEEVAYDVYPLSNSFDKIGAGMIGKIEKTSANELFNLLKEKFNCKTIRHTQILNEPIEKVAICGGSGSFLINAAKAQQADVFITGDLKYHDFFEADGQILLVDIGPSGSEQFTKELIYSILTKKFPTFALRISDVDTNPVNYV
ncbi:MAG: Nif3-like dinuclear metal center hexameric protein [Bacteroidetes bacterium]|nr:Nif3-like dinuclear metal center hexameric protein [Bacteroidota bacterium]